jgi:8-oxo-dGTP diphosphatase
VVDRQLEAYRQQRYAKPLVAVDVVALTVLDADQKILLVKRGLPPFAGELALPGGFVRCGDGASDQGEDIDDAAARELAEETRLPQGSVRLEQLGVWGDPDRDPRDRVVSIAYIGVVRPELAAYARAGTDAAHAVWLSTSELPRVRLAFDHARIVDAALAKLRADVDRTAVARDLVAETFSAAELRAAVEAVQGRRIDAANFRRKLLALVEKGVVAPAPGKRVTGKRPAAVYRFVSPSPTA